MTTLFELLWAMGAGAGLAWAFCRHLNWCLERVPHAASPFGFWSLHWAIRLGGVLTGFYLVGAGNPVRLVVCLAGFVAARFWLTRNPLQNQPVVTATK